MQGIKAPCTRGCFQPFRNRPRKETCDDEPHGKQRDFHQSFDPTRECKHTQDFDENPASHDPGGSDSCIQDWQSMANFGKSIHGMAPRPVNAAKLHLQKSRCAHNDLQCAADLQSSVEQHHERLPRWKKSTPPLIPDLFAKHILHD